MAVLTNYHLFVTTNSSDAAKDALRKEVEILKTKAHWKKAYFYLWDEVIASFRKFEND